MKNLQDLNLDEMIYLNGGGDGFWYDVGTVIGYHAGINYNIIRATYKAITS